MERRARTAPPLTAPHRTAPQLLHSSHPVWRADVEERSESTAAGRSVDVGYRGSAYKQPRQRPFFDSPRWTWSPFSLPLGRWRELATTWQAKVGIYPRSTEQSWEWMKREADRGLYQRREYSRRACWDTASCWDSNYRLFCILLEHSCR